jgi:cytochrome c
VSDIIRRQTALAGIAALAFALASCGRQEPANEQDAAPTAPVNVASPTAVAPATSNGPPEFAVCTTCHSIEKGENGIGPSLFGIVDTKAAAVPDYDFSPAMKEANITWDAATLDRYIENPYAVVPGTKMPFAGMKDPAKRAKVIAYLTTLK